MPVLEQDTFVRTSVGAGSWGTATNGDAWSITQGTASNFSTNGTQGVMVNTGGRSHTRIGSTSDTNQVVTCDITPSNVSNDEFGVNARQSGTVGTGISLYRVTYSPSLGGFVLFKAVTGTATQLGSTVTKSVSNLTKYSFKLSCIGTLIQGKMWLAGTSEPSTWDISVTDSSVSNGAPGCTGNSFDATGIRYENFLATDGTVQKDITVRGRISQQVGKDITVRGRISQQIKKDITIRGRLSQQVQKDVTIRGKISGPRIASGGFALFANGTGTAQFDSFRVTQYPDPALSLAPVLPHVGSTSVAWNEVIPTGTTVGIDISTDGVNWTDVSANNGAALPGIFSQPDATMDGFDSDTSSNYTSTFRTGGSIATPTYDTANSRLALTGGVNALYVYSAINRSDIDFFATMDRSDAGGLVWRYVDQSNFYYVLVGDSLASVGTPNTITLYKIVANVQTQLGTTSIAFTRGTYHNVRVSMIGGLIIVYYDGAVAITGTDISPLGAGKMGLFNNGGTVGSRYYQLWMTPQGDYVSGTPAGDVVTGKFVYTRQRLSSTDPTQTPQVLGLTTSAYSPTIDDGVLMPSADYRYTFINANFDDLAKQSNYAWWIAGDNSGKKILYFQHRQALPAPWVLYSSSLMGAVDLEADNNLLVDVSNDLYRNRQILTGVINTATFTDTFIGDGQLKSFTLRYPIAPGTTPTITLNTQNQTEGLKGTSGFQWYYAIGDSVIAEDQSGTVLQKTDSLSITYTGTFADTVIADNLVAQAALAKVEGGSGIVEAVEDVSSRNMTFAAGTTYANQLLARYCITVNDLPSGRTLTFTTVRNGLQVGQILSVFIPEEGLFDASMYITAMDITMRTQPNNTILYYYAVTATELPNIGSWQKLFASSLLLT